mgnify:CR=1 FL=1
MFEYLILHLKKSVDYFIALINRQKSIFSRYSFNAFIIMNMFVCNL